MIGKIVKSISLLVLICLLLVSCKTEPILVLKKNISVTSVTLYKEGNILYTDDFLRFDFTTVMSLSKLTAIKSLLQVRVSFLKGGKVISKDIASGPFLISNSSSEEITTGGDYSAYIFKSLLISQDNQKNTIAIDNLDFDSLNIIVVYPIMGGGIKYSSEIFEYSKEYINSVISNPKGEIILTL